VGYSETVKKLRSRFSVPVPLAVTAAVLPVALFPGACGTTDRQDSPGTTTSATGQVAADWSGPVEVDPLGDVEPVTGDPGEGRPEASRIIVLDQYGTLTRILDGLGLSDRIVGRSVASSEPALADVPVVTRHGHEIDVEAVLQQHPGLVLIDEKDPSGGASADAVAQLRAAGVTVEAVDLTRNPDTVADSIRTVAGHVGLPEVGEKLAARSQDSVDRARRTVADLSGRAGGAQPRMLFLFQRGTGTFLMMGGPSGGAPLIPALGGRDVAGEQGVDRSVPATAEAIAAMDPEIILTVRGGGGVDELMKQPGVAESTAGREGRIVALPDAEAMSFGPQTGDSLSRYAEAVWQGR
jgi:iron complex transport system substrate-binding protein